MRNSIFVAVIATVLFMAAPALAQVTIGSVGSGIAAGAYSEDSAGQAFVVPGGVSRLDKISLGVSGTGTFTLALQRRADYGGVTFVALSPVMASSTPSPGYLVATYTIPSGVTVTPGEQFVILRNVVSGSADVAFLGTDHYPADDSFADGTFAADDAVFLVVFDQPVPVPTLSEWAMIMLGLLMAGGAALHLQRQRITAWSRSGRA